MVKSLRDESASFYEALAPLADKIFPLSVRQTSFFEDLFAKTGATSLLDVACGAGSFACHFALRGMQVVALDAVPAMVRVARKRSMESGAGMRVVEADMSDLGKLDLGSFDAITCLGNSLPHLEGEEAVFTFCRSSRSHLAASGVLAVQTVNMDSFLSIGRIDFPRLSAQASGGIEVSLLRSYSLFPNRIHISFKTELRVGHDTKRFETRLLCILKDTLERAFLEAGFSRVECYGDYQRSKWSESSPATLVVGYV